MIALPVPVFVALLVLALLGVVYVVLAVGVLVSRELRYRRGMRSWKRGPGPVKP